MLVKYELSIRTLTYQFCKRLGRGGILRRGCRRTAFRNAPAFICPRYKGEDACSSPAYRAEGQIGRRDAALPAAPVHTALLGNESFDRIPRSTKYNYAGPQIRTGIAPKLRIGSFRALTLRFHDACGCATVCECKCKCATAAHATFLGAPSQLSRRDLHTFTQSPLTHVWEFDSEPVTGLLLPAPAPSNKLTSRKNEPVTSIKKKWNGTVGGGGGESEHERVKVK